jgi:hypothetical protein
MADTKISALTAATSVADADLIPIVQSGANKKATRELVRGYKVYTALLTQSGASAPTATVLENTLGGTVVWARSNTGLYTATLAGAFTASKTWCDIRFDSSDAAAATGFNEVKFRRTSDNVVALETGDGADPIEISGNANVDAAHVEIRVYP